MTKHVVRLLFLTLVLIATLIPDVASAQGAPPPLPHAFLGSVEVNGQPAPVGALVEVRGDGVKIGTDTNPLSVTAAGRYGGPTRSEIKLAAQGTLRAGQALEFYVDGVRAQCARPDGEWQDTFPYDPGVITELNLRVGVAPSPTASPTATVTVAPIVVSTSTSTATLATTGSSAQATSAPTSTATSQPAGASPTPAAGGQAPTATPLLAVATATVSSAAVVATPTGQAAGNPAGASVTPVTGDAQITVAPSPTELPPAATLAPTKVLTATPAVVAVKPEVTVTPILVAAAPANKQPVETEALSQSSQGAASRAVALWGGLGALLVAVAIVLILRLRGLR